MFLSAFHVVTARRFSNTPLSCPYRDKFIHVHACDSFPFVFFHPTDAMTHSNERFSLAIHVEFLLFIFVSVLRFDVVHFIDQFKISFGDYL